MKSLLAFFLLFVILKGSAQSVKKYAVGQSGCSVYMFCDPGAFDKTYSEDSSEVYTGQCVKDSITYGLICVKLLEPVSSLDDAEELLIQYLDFLKGMFEIKKAAGYGKGHRLKDREDTRGIIDYWEDEEKNSWKMKAWTDGRFIAVLYGYSKKELPETRLNVFLESFRLPGM